MSIISGGIWGPLSWPHPAFLLAVALCGSQLSLAAIWVGAGSGWFPWRLAGFFATVAFWGVLSEVTCPNMVASRPEILTDLSASLFIFMEPFLIFWVLFPLRTAGFRLVRNGNGGTTASGPDVRTPRQFSLSYLLAWMTAIAVVLSTLRYLVLNGFPFLPVSIFSKPDGDTLGCLAKLVLFWAVLGSRRPILTAAIPCLLLLLGVVPAFFSPTGKLVIVETALLVGAFSVIRAAGYRLRRDMAGKTRNALIEQGGPEPAQRRSVGCV